MKVFLESWQLLLLVLAGRVNRQQQEVIEYLLVENRVLRQKVGRRRILLNDAQRRRLAVKGEILGREILEQVASMVTPETILRWHRELVGRHWDNGKRRKNAGRPMIPQEAVDLVLRLAKESPSWGCKRIRGAVGNLGCVISDTSVANILRADGIDPAPDGKRQCSWKDFLHTHWDVLASVDFTTIGVWTKKGLATYYLLFFMELATRRVHFAGLTMNSDEDWMLQIARNVSDAEQGFLRGKRYLLMDRDGKFSEALRITLGEGGVELVQLPARSPNLTLHIERFMRSLKEESLERIVFFGEASLRAAAVSYLEHFHMERNHQGIGNRLLMPGNEVGRPCGAVACRQRLGGLLGYYYRAAA